MRLAIGASIKVNKRVVGLHYIIEGKGYDDSFIVLDLDDKFDVILGLPWLRKFEPWISWQHRTVKLPAACSSDGHLMNVFERPQACGCPTSECDVLTCGTVVSTTAQEDSVDDRYSVEHAAGDCVDTTQAALKVHHSNKSSGPRQGCLPRGPHPSIKKSVARDRQSDNPRSTGESIVEDLAVVAQSQLEEVEGISPDNTNAAEISFPNLEGISPREGKGIITSKAE